eukprot:367017-Pelagomonas_calceolata.AAC.2
MRGVSRLAGGGGTAPQGCCSFSSVAVQKGAAAFRWWQRTLVMQLFMSACGCVQARKVWVSGDGGGGGGGAAAAAAACVTSGCDLLVHPVAATCSRNLLLQPAAAAVTARATHVAH